MTETDPPCLHVCVVCRGGRVLAEGETPLGRMLHDALAASDAVRDGAVGLRKVECLYNCAQGCSAAVSMAGKWSYLLGRLTPSLAADVLAYAATYAASTTGTVMPSRRPASLANAVIGRFPPAEMAA